MTIEEWLGEDNQLGIDIWHKKYQYKDETFEEWLDRVSGGEEDLRELIKEKKFLFGGRTLANRNTGKKGSYSNCYTRGKIDDNLNDIIGTNVDLALTYKAQGGQGLSLSNLRPKGCGINKGQFESDGIIPFMKIYNETTKGISQGGSRKGALIMTLDIWHKEAKDFITIKSQSGEIEKANLSLEIDDQFMEAVKEYYETGKIVKKTVTKEYEGNKVVYEVTPIDLYKLMINTAYDWGEPGCIFTNRFYNYNFMEFDEDYQIEASNPCGEQPLPKHGACNLGSINLSAFVIDPFTDNSRLDITELIRATKIAVRALDKVLDENSNNHPLEQQRKMSKNYRNIGLGIMGMHDMLIKLGCPYCSISSFNALEEVMKTIFKSSIETSVELAVETGRFPGCKKEVMLESNIIKKNIELLSNDIIEKIKKYGLRNCSLLSIAPSGSIATMLNISTGCEPIFRVSYDRKTEGLDGKENHYKVYTGIAKEYMIAHPDKMLPKDLFVTADKIKWSDRIDVQSILQNYVDTGISSTINLPHDISVEEIEQLYLYAWEKGLKGITIFRDRCKRQGVLTDKNINNTLIDFNYDSISPITREELKVSSLDGKTYTKRIACGKLNITINHDDNNRLLEVFVNSGKSGGCSANANCLGRYASTALRSGIKVEDIIDTTKGIKCSACANAKGKGEMLDGISCGDAIAKTIEEEYNRLKSNKSTKFNNFAINPKTFKVVDAAKCPECGSTIIHEGGCQVCRSCGWSKCS